MLYNTEVKNKLLCIVGPTGVGKTELALSLAQKLNGALISADSIQVFTGLDIISGKDKPADFSLTPLLIDILPPTQSYSAHEFASEASKAISQIIHSDKLPILVGGTGLYIKSLIEGLDTEVKPNIKLRLELEKSTVEKLQTKLKKLNPKKFDSLNNSDINNKRRLIRAIEVGKIKNQKSRIIKEKTFKSLVIGLFAPHEILKERIDKRVQKRIDQGALREAGELFCNYSNLTPQVKNANGYKQLFAFFNKELSLKEAIYRWKISEYRHAKNQMTWFRKYGNVVWFDVSKDQFNSKIEKYLTSKIQQT